MLDGDRVVGFTRPATRTRNYHFIGVQVAEARAFAALPDGQAMESVNQVYPALLAKDRRAICGFVSDASFQDIGTPADYLRTCLELARSEGDRLVSDKGVSVNASAVLKDCVVWDDVTIDSGACLEASIICDDARVPPGVHYTRCVILPLQDHVPADHERIESGLLVSPF